MKVVNHKEKCWHWLLAIFVAACSVLLFHYEMPFLALISITYVAILILDASELEAKKLACGILVVVTVISAVIGLLGAYSGEPIWLLLPIIAGLTLVVTQ